jgi:glutathione-regulated potassium-efflux system ancillary protein KefG
MYGRRMGRKIDVDDLIDAQEAAKILGLAHRNTVSEYQRRYPEMPRPVVDRRNGRLKLWLRPELERWADGHRKRSAGRGRPRLIDQRS